MSSRLLNVRLDKHHLRMVQSLRANGVVVSDVVREAIEQQYAQLQNKKATRDADAIMAEIDARYPIDIKDIPPQNYNVHDRKEAAAAIRRILKRKHRRKP